MPYRSVNDHLKDAVALNARRAVSPRPVPSPACRATPATNARAATAASPRQVRRHRPRPVPHHELRSWVARCAAALLLLIVAGLVGAWWAQPIPTPTPADYPVSQIGDVVLDPAPLP